METYYKKVEIKTEADLPKKSGGYDTNMGFIHFNHKEQRMKPIFQSLHQKIDSVEYWLHYIDWYLLPVDQEPQKEVLSLDEWLDKEYPSFWIDMSSDGGLSKKTILSIMEEYHSQFNQRQVTDISDEDIEVAADLHSSFTGVGNKKNNNIAKQVSFMQGARWMRDKLSGKC